MKLSVELTDTQYEAIADNLKDYLIISEKEPSESDRAYNIKIAIQRYPIFNAKGERLVWFRGIFKRVIKKV